MPRETNDFDIGDAVQLSPNDPATAPYGGALGIVTHTDGETARVAIRVAGLNGSNLGIVYTNLPVCVVHWVGKAIWRPEDKGHDLIHGWAEIFPP